MAKKTTKKKVSGAAKPAKKSAAKPAAKASRAPAPSKAAAAKPNSSKVNAAKMKAAKANSAKPATTKPGAPKPGQSKANPAKPGVAKTTAAKAGSAKPSPAKKSPPAVPAPQPAKAKAPAGGAAKPGKTAKVSPKSAPAAAAARPAAEPSPTKPSSPASKAGGDAGKSGRKGITIVTPKPVKKSKPKSTTGTVPALSGSILGMGLGVGRPLIPSGPPSVASTASDNDLSAGGKKPKTPFTKRQLDKYQEVLLAKRRELLGDIDSMENEALKSQSGSLSHLPQHMAEQGSETYEQSLSLDLAAADRVLLREIDAALQRIEDRTYGLCEHTGRQISKERLAELPWARYSIEAAREMERRTT